MKFLVPQGIGDAVWALLKIQDANDKLGGGPIDVRIACLSLSKAESRALEFVRKFDFVSSAEMYIMPSDRQGAVLQSGQSAKDGYYRYILDGPTNLSNIDYVLMPNAPLERGIRLEDWLPQFAINWKVMSHFVFAEQEVYESDVPFVAFFCGPLDGNTYAGHNRNSLWTPEQWVELGERIKQELNVKIIVVGSDMDKPYYEKKIAPILSDPWISVIGDYSIGQTYALLRKARFIISYQSGIGIVSNYFGVPLGIFWRAKGDSIHPSAYISFEESMASAWADPKMIESGKHMPLIYGRHDVNYIMDQIKIRKW